MYSSPFFQRNNCPLLSPPEDPPLKRRKVLVPLLFPPPRWWKPRPVFSSRGGEDPPPYPPPLIRSPLLFCFLFFAVLIVCYFLSLPSAFYVRGLVPFFERDFLLKPRRSLWPSTFPPPHRGEIDLSPEKEKNSPPSPP